MALLHFGSKRTTSLNTISVILLQLANIASSLIIPRLVLETFGSEVNGLVLSLTQFLNFISLIEGGINSVIMANLYKPLVENNTQKISSIIKTSNKFFKKIATIIVLYTIILAILYPVFSKSSFSWHYIFTLTMILGVKLFIQYCFSFTLKNLLNADKKVYIVSLTQIILVVLEMSLNYILVKTWPNIHLIKLVSALIFIIQPIVFNYYTKKHYRIDKEAIENKKLLSARWDGFAINTAAFVHGNTDIAIISVFLTLKDASVYGVYALVTTGLKTICQSLWKALAPSIGKIYASGDKRLLNKRFDTFEYLTFFMTFFMFSIAGLLITPFVQLYVADAVDANYFQPLFGTILLIAEGIYILREPYVNLAYGANRFKDLRTCAIVEVILNIVISLSLASWLGLTGIALGTLIAMTYRTIYQVYYLKKYMIGRPILKFIKNFIIFLLPSILIAAVCAHLLPIRELNARNWVYSALLYSAIYLVGYSVISFIFFRPQLIDLIKYFKRKK
ncbi:polysaccharide biosynthesis protein [Candidatus Saccharibacteria bacterium]|nr:polysaccharide biosynthesis protein [Candidatus Saccharibacteria bacterium]